MTEAEYEKVKAAIVHEVYDCPVYFSPGSRCLQQGNIIASLTLPSAKVKASLWAERRVYLTCCINSSNRIACNWNA